MKIALLGGMRITDDKLHGRVVLSADGIAVGEISKLIMEGSQFAIEGVEIKLRKEIAERLGLKKGMFSSATIEIPVGLVQSVGDAVLLSAVIEDLRALPSIAAHTPRDSSPEHEEAPLPART